MCTFWLIFALEFDTEFSYIQIFNKENVQHYCMSKIFNCSELTVNIARKETVIVIIDTYNYFILSLL